MWNLPPPPGFVGLREDRAVVTYRRHLPHWRQADATSFVTFRLNDSLPRAKLRELALFREEWERRHPPPRRAADHEELGRGVFERIERWLDQGHGACPLRRPELSALIVQALHQFDGDRYELGCYVVMPNHVHGIVRPLGSIDDPLEDITGSWKSFSARRINAALGRSGALWQEECYDRIIRDEEHLWRTIQYIGRNPERARLSAEACSLWIRPEWEALGWTFERHP